MVLEPQLLAEGREEMLALRLSLALPELLREGCRDTELRPEALPLPLPSRVAEAPLEALPLREALLLRVPCSLEGEALLQEQGLAEAL